MSDEIPAIDGDTACRHRREARSRNATSRTVIGSPCDLPLRPSGEPAFFRTHVKDVVTSFDAIAIEYRPSIKGEGFSRNIRHIDQT